ncbi:MAG: Hsp70 family protein [Deltaproteobacteria bacterium]|nr:Hsp70 family protein [Deltaproteobacteria bacterium]
MNETPHHTAVDAAIKEAENLRDSRAVRESVLIALRGLGSEEASLTSLQRIFKLFSSIEDESVRTQALLDLVGFIPMRGDFFEFLEFTAIAALESVDTIEFATHRKSALMRLAEELPESIDFNPLYGRILDVAIVAANLIKDISVRSYALKDIFTKLKERGTLDDLALKALKVCLGFADEYNDERFKKYSFEAIARGLPKVCDYEFYRKSTFFGIASALPRRGEFLDLYKRAMEVAVEASVYMGEPFQRKYALLFMAGELPKEDEYRYLYKLMMEAATDAVMEIVDVFARQYALLDVLKELPKERDFSELILKIVEASLGFFSVRSRMSDVELVDVLDFLIGAEERRLRDSVKKQYTRDHYAERFLTELKVVASELKDVRLLEILSPLTHKWVKPDFFRNGIKGIISDLDGLKKSSHGREIERPVFVSERQFKFEGDALSGEKKTERGSYKDTLAIDLGASNTVILRSLDGGLKAPESVCLEGISETHCEFHSVPTLIDSATGKIGTEAAPIARSVNIKKALLEDAPGSSDMMERYLKALFGYINNTLPRSGWFVRKVADRLSITVPVGFGDYGKRLSGILSGVARGMAIEFVEEPLAAAIGYEVAEETDKLVLVFDFGGCTLDVMLLRLNVDELHVVAKPDRSKMLGGRDIDAWFAEYLEERINCVGLSPERLLIAAEEVKIALSDRESVAFTWEGREIGDITRDDFEGVLNARGFYDDLDREISYVLKKAAKIGVDSSMIEAVLLTGGSSQIPSFKEKVADNFYELGTGNKIYDHSPLTAVAKGAALYGTSGVVDRHLGMAYALRYVADTKEGLRAAYEVVLEKGESLPIEKTFKVRAGCMLGAQSEVYLELFEVPERLLTRRWVNESGMEFIKQTLKTAPTKEAFDLKPLKVVSVKCESLIEGDLTVTLLVDESGRLSLRYNKEDEEPASAKTEIRLQ